MPSIKTLFQKCQSHFSISALTPKKLTNENFYVTLSGLVTVMVSMVTCGAPILPTAGSLKQKTCKQNVILNTKY